MNTTSLKLGIQKAINNISEIWFLLILAVPTQSAKEEAKGNGQFLSFFFQ